MTINFWPALVLNYPKKVGFLVSKAEYLSSFTNCQKDWPENSLNVSLPRPGLSVGLLKKLFFEKERFHSKWKKSLFQNTFYLEAYKGTEESFHSKILLIVFQESLENWKFLHFLVAELVWQLGMREARCTETPLHGLPNPNFLPRVDIWIWKKKTVQNYGD